MTLQKRLFQVAVVLCAAISPRGAEAKDWFAGVGATLTGTDSKSGFHFAMAGDRSGDVTGGGLDATTNSFPPDRNRTLAYNLVANETLAEFTGTGNIFPLSGNHGFGLYGTGKPPKITSAAWEPNGPSVPIVSYTWVNSTTNLIKATVTNSHLNEGVSIRAPGWCLNCPQDVAPSGFSPPHIDLTPIPEFEVTLQPGESRETTLQGNFGDDPLVGFYAEAVFANSPDGPIGTIWVQTIVPEPSSFALAAVVCFIWVGCRTRRVRHRTF